MNRFDVPTMIGISDPWVDDEKDKPILESMPLTAGLVPILVTTHNRLALLRLIPSETEKVMHSLSERAGVLDLAHDEKFRSLYWLLIGIAAASENERRAEIEEVIDTLMPDGLAGTQKSFLAESGAVELAVSKMHPKIEGILKGIVVDGKSCLERFDEWTASGRELGDVERERARITKKQAQNVVTAKDVVKARFKWIRAVNVLVELFDLDEDIPEETRIRILKPLRNAEAKFARKAAKAKNAAKDSDPSEKSETDAPPDPASKAKS